MKKNYQDCKYCGGNVSFARFRLGYDYCMNDLCVGRGLKNHPVVKVSGYLPGHGLTPRKVKLTVSGLSQLRELLEV